MHKIDLNKKIAKVVFWLIPKIFDNFIIKKKEIKNIKNDWTKIILFIKIQPRLKH